MENGYLVDCMSEMGSNIMQISLVLLGFELNLFTIFVKRCDFMFPAERLNNYDIIVTDRRPVKNATKNNYTEVEVCASGSEPPRSALVCGKGNPVRGRYVVVRLKSTGRRRFLAFCEVKVKFGQ